MDAFDQFFNVQRRPEVSDQVHGCATQSSFDTAGGVANTSAEVDDMRHQAGYSFVTPRSVTRTGNLLLKKGKRSRNKSLFYSPTLIDTNDSCKFGEDDETIQNIAFAINEVVEQTAYLNLPNSFLEMEARFGTITGNKYTPSVAHDRFQEFSKKIFKKKEEEIITYAYDSILDQNVLQRLGIPDHMKKYQLRTSVSETSTVTQLKLPICALFLKNTNYVGNVDGMDVKISFALEVTLTDEQIKHYLPRTMSTSNTRIKHRASFHHKQWRYDLTKVYSSGTRSRAEHALESQPVYEVELEYLSDIRRLIGQNPPICHHTEVR